MEKNIGKESLMKSKSSEMMTGIKVVSKGMEVRKSLTKFIALYGKNIKVRPLGNLAEVGESGSVQTAGTLILFPYIAINFVSDFLTYIPLLTTLISVIISDDLDFIRTSLGDSLPMVFPYSSI